MNEGGANQPAPLVHNGVVYLNNPGNIMQAINGKTGDLIWENRYGIAADRRRHARHRDLRRQGVRRDERRAAGGARRQDRQDRLADDDRRSVEGQLQHEQRPAPRQGQADSGPGRLPDLPRREVLHQRLRRRDGQRSCGGSTPIAKQGEPGGDTWGPLTNLFRAGGESWITGSYDPVLNLTYWGTAQAKPWMPISRGMSIKDDALYTSSTLALDVDTGKLAWHFQHAPAESLDLDVVFERVLVDDNDQNLVFTVGKDGVLWKLDRKTGKYLGHKETVFQNVWERFDPQTGRPTYRSDILEQRFGEWMQGCPSTEGGHNWPASSYHAGTNQLIIPLSQSCIEISAQKVEQKEGGGSGGGAGRRFYELPGSDGNIGKLAAFDVQDPEGNVVLRAAGAVHDRGDLDGRRRGVRRRSRSPVPRVRRQDRQGAVGDAAGDVGAGVPGVVQHRRQAVHRHHDRQRRRQPAARAGDDRAGTASSGDRQCDVLFALPDRR